MSQTRKAVAAMALAAVGVFAPGCVLGPYGGDPYEESWTDDDGDDGCGLLGLIVSICLNDDDDDDDDDRPRGRRRGGHRGGPRRRCP